MADTSGNDSVHVTAEKRLHPAYRKLARAFIALARLRQHAPPEQSPASDEPSVEKKAKR